MSPASGTRAVLRVQGDPRLALDATHLRELDDRALAAWLMERRWFGSKGAEPVRAHVLDAVGMPGAELPAAMSRVEVHLSDGRVERYQIPLVLRQEREPSGGTLARVDVVDGDGVDAANVLDGADSAGHESSGRAGRAGDGETWWIADGGSDVAVARRILLAFAEGESFREGDVEWRFEAEEGVDLSALPHASPKPAGAEQSNTSLRCGDFAMLKFYRKLEAGAHPEVEMMRYLTRVARFPHTPALLGVGEVDDSHGGSEVSSMLQALVPGARDAWELGLERATAFIGAAGEEDPPNPFVKEMRELGRNTRAMHEALAGAMEDPALMPADADVEDVTQWTRRARSLQLDALDLLAQRREAGGVPGLSAAAADAVLRRRSELVAALDDVPSVVQGNAGLRIRHHGDYHLGQVLHDREGRFWIIDFEGEPARLLAERRARHSPLRDVAGMLRSFAYAAATAAQTVGGVGVRAIVELRLSRWERAARDAFLTGYHDWKGAASALLPPEQQVRERLLALFETEKVFYELAYELNNRPEWTWIPLRGIGRMLGR